MGNNLCMSENQISNQSDHNISFSTQDIDILHRKVTTPTKPIPLGQIAQMNEEKDDDLEEIGKHFRELEKKQ